MKMRIDELINRIRPKKDDEGPTGKPTLTREEKAAIALEKQKKKRDEKKVTLVGFTYDEERDCYIWDEKTNVMMKDVPEDAVHITGKKGHYLHTDIWDDLIWPKTDQSAIHMYLWMINTRINPEAITEKGKKDDIDLKKIVMYGAIAIVVILVAWQFIPR